MDVNVIYEGDCLDIMRQLPDNCIDSIITDPPYELTGSSGNGGFMGKHWDATGIAFNPTVWRECLRIAKPGATLMAFGGSRTHHRLACAIEDAGWEIRDCISYFHDGTQQEQAFMASLDEEQLAAYLELHYPGYQMSWVYGSGFPKSHDVSKAIDAANGMEREVIGRNPNDRDKNSTIAFNGKGNGYITAPASPLAAKFSGCGSALKPAFEPIILAMAPMGQSYAVNAEQWAVAGLWIDGCRVPTNWDTDPTRRGWQGGGTQLRYDQSYRKVNGSKSPPSSLGRYPSNVLISAEPGVLAEFDKAGVSVSNGATRKNNVSLGNSGNNIYGKGTRYFEGNGHDDRGTPARFFAHCPPDTSPARFIYQAKASNKERGSSNGHPTVKPLSLVRYLCRLTRTPDGGVVLDPFAGSGTTALACIAEGRDYILIEKEAAYVDICKRRIAEYTGQAIEAKEIELTTNQTIKQLGLW